MSIKFNPFVLEGLDIAGGNPSPTVGSTPVVGSSGNSILTTDSSGVLDEKVLTDGQLLVGSTGNEPVAAALTGTTDQVSVTNNPGQIVLSLPQDIATTSSPEFAAVQTGVLDRATPGTLTIGAVNGDVINIGNPGSQVNLQGDVNILNSTILEVENPLILINDGGPAASAGGAGIEVEEANIVTGYSKISADRTAWELKAPAQAGNIQLQPPTSGSLVINQALFDSKYDASNPLGFETPAQLDARDTANRNRTNHTGTQLSSTISDFDTAVDVRVDLHADLTNNPHSVTKAQVGLGNVDNTSDLDKPISTATQTALDLKANTADLGDLALLDQVDTAQIVNQAVTNTKLENMNSNTLKGRASGNGTPQDLTASEVRAVLEVETTTQLNDRDTANRDRANHTGTQLASTISDFVEASQDAVAAAISAGTQDGLTVTYDDVTDSIDFTNTDKGSAAVATHELASDPHPQYLTETEADLLYDEAGAASIVQTALSTHITDTTDAHIATAIGFTSTGTLTSTNVSDALDEVNSNLDTKADWNLGNLSPLGTAINNDLRPNTDITRNLGSSSLNWNTAHVQSIIGRVSLSLSSGLTGAATGAINVISGNRTGVGNSGSLIVSSGDQSAGTGESGSTTIRTGSGVNASGLVNLTTGNTSAGSSTSGAINITTGNGILGSGNVVLTTGTGSVRGQITLDARQVDVSNVKIVNLADPTAAQDAATKAYVDSLISTPDASTVTVTPAGNLTSTNVQDALVELQTDIDTISSSNVSGSASLPNNTADIVVLDISSYDSFILQYRVNRSSSVLQLNEIGTIHAIKIDSTNWTFANGGIAGDGVVTFSINSSTSELLCTTSDLTGTGYTGTFTYKLTTI